MIKYFYISIVFILSSVCLQARMVPNFVAKDINGETHNLYDYLNEDKVVIVDVFATWCSGCWTNFKKDKLANLYNTYGPNGTDQLMVLFVEGDVDTQDAALFHDNPFGNWTEDVPYPIFNPEELDTTFVQAFASNGVPTINVICPSTRENIADIFSSDLTDMIETIAQCSAIERVIDLQLLGEAEVSKPICDNTDISFEVLNTGTETINTFKVSVLESVGALIGDYVFKGELYPGTSFGASLGNYSLPNILDTQLVNIVLDFDDAVAVNNTQGINFIHAPEVHNELTLYVRSDFWVEEDNTRWWVENSANEIVTPVYPLQALTEQEFNFFLEDNDCFTFVIAEDFGDGMVLGELMLFDDQGNILYDDATFGSRGEGSFEYFSTIATSTSSVEDNQNQLAIHPNLVTDNLQIDYRFDPKLATTLQIYNAQGVEMYSTLLTAAITTGETFISVQDYPQGIYFATMENENGQLTERFVKP